MSVHLRLSWSVAISTLIQPTLVINENEWQILLDKH